MSMTPALAARIKQSLSAARMSTYDLAMAHAPDPAVAGLELYAWNADTSAAFLAPLHVCEVVVRNAAAEALEIIYGPRWPWSPGFERSLHNPPLGYSEKRDLFSARQKQTTTGKVIPELKFVFWQKLFTARNDQRLWTPHLRRVFPNLSATTPIASLRAGLFADLEAIRTLRNRIAHHEPIFSRNLIDELAKIESLVRSRSTDTAQWMMSRQLVTGLLAAKP